MTFLRDLFHNFISFVLMIFMSIISFFFTVFVVDFGAALAGYPQNPYTVLSAAILVAASIIAGGISPLGFLSQSTVQDRPDEQIQSREP